MSQYPTFLEMLQCKPILRVETPEYQFGENSNYIQVFHRRDRSASQAVQDLHADINMALLFGLKRAELQSGLICRWTGGMFYWAAQMLIPLNSLYLTALQPYRHYTDLDKGVLHHTFTWEIGLGIKEPQ